MGSLGIPPEQFCLPGEVVLHEEWTGVADVQSRSSDRAKSCEPMSTSSRTASRGRTDERGNPALPSSWTKTNACTDLIDAVVTWPFDPVNPKPGDPPLTGDQAPWP
jgi:hypothetical protein